MDQKENTEADSQDEKKKCLSGDHDSNGKESVKKSDNALGISSPKDEDTIDHEHEDILLASGKLMSMLSDRGKFSYLSICSTALALLYGSPEDKVYRHKTVYSLVKHVGLDGNCYPTMVAISDGHDCCSGTSVFIETLMEDQCAKEKPIMVAEDLVLWALLYGTSDGTDGSLRGRYDARTRTLIRHITWQLHIVLEDLEAVEHDMVKMLEACTEKENAEQEEDRMRNERRRKWKRYALIGVAAAGGGALIGLTGGLAAPLVAAGAGTILGASSAAALGSMAGMAVITSLFGAAGAGLTGYKMKRRVGGIEKFLFRPLTPGKELTITIAISGWLSSSQGEGDFAIPWMPLRQSNEQYYLVWETSHLIRLGSALEYLLDSLVSVAATEALKYTVLSGLVAAVAWPASLLGAASVIDNPWSVCLQRSTQVGKQLAEVLLSRQHGHRPVTLVGFSLGARVIFYCLEEMAKRKNHSGIVEDVILLGAPVTGSAEKWEKFATVVAGHITNGYCRSDWLLQFLYRTSSRQSEVAGLQPVTWEDRKMINIDLTSVVEGHMDYRKNMDTLLSAVGVRSNKDALDAASQLSVIKSKKSVSMPELKTSETSSPPAEVSRSATISLANVDGPSDNNETMGNSEPDPLASKSLRKQSSEYNGEAHENQSSCTYSEGTESYQNLSKTYYNDANDNQTGISSSTENELTDIVNTDDPELKTL